jgi:uncharacterized membrane protein
MVEIIPNWHPILVHFTIALLGIAALLFGVAAIWRGRRWSAGIETAANWNLWLGAAVTALTVAAGLQAAGSVAHDEAAHLAMENHKFWALGTAALFVLLALWNGLRVRRAGPIGFAFVALLAVAAVGLAGTGLRGADLVFRHGVGVLALPEPGGEGHTHDGEAAHAGQEDGRGAPPAAAAAWSAGESAVIAALTAYHTALTTGNASAPEPYVLTDERFLMIEGEHVNQGWADYRDNHLKGELADLAKVRFRLSGYRIQMNAGLAAVSFNFSILPRTGPERDFGSGRGTAILVRTDSGWKLQQLHTS